MVIIMATERLTEFITIKGFIGEVLKRICIVHTFAASSGSNVRAMGLFENNLVSTFDHETGISCARDLTSGRTWVSTRWIDRQTILSPHASS